MAPGAQVFVLEAGVDVQVSLLRSTGESIALSDHPTPRFGAQRMVMASNPMPDVLVIRSKEHEGHTGYVRMLIVAAAGVGAGCSDVTRALAAADGTYARGYAIARAHTPREQQAAREAYSDAARQYAEILALPASRASARLQGELELALSNLHYHDLQEWIASEDWATRAAKSFRAAKHDYGLARAQAMVAAARMEVATKSSAPARRTDVPGDSRSLLDSARALLAQLAQFHARREERYDEALQVNNIGLAYYYEARFEKAIEWYEKARASFAVQGEKPRLALAMQNIALCEWGLGRLRASLPRFDQALQIMRPEPYPDLYLLTLNNSGLAHYAAGRFDESLRLHNQALDFALGIQNDRYRARALYGIGVTYYAIGERALAAKFLQDALQIWTPDLDARGRVGALRALATIEHENGNYQTARADNAAAAGQREDARSYREEARASYAAALNHNSEALRLATAPSARAWILLRLARDYAARGERAAAMEILQPLTSYAPNGDVLIQAAARLARGKLLRASGSYAQAQADIASALETFRNLQALAEQFEAGEELARLQVALGRPDDALATIDDALALTDELRTQTANPEYRASIVQAIRPALDLKIDLLRARYDRLVAAGRHGEARAIAIESLRTADESRSRAFEEVVLQRSGTGRDPQIADLVAVRETILRDLADRRFYLSTRADRAGTADTRAGLLRAEIARLRVRLGVIDTRLASLAATDRVVATGDRAGSWIDRVLQAPPHRALVEYWTGSKDAYAWSIVAGRIAWLKLAETATIEQAGRRLHGDMLEYTSVSTAERLAACEDLHRLVVEPLSVELRGAKDLLIVADGILHFVPFGALRDRSSDRPYLVERLTISFAPALRLVYGMGTSAPSRTQQAAAMLMVADPIYRADDPRLGGSSAGGRREDARSATLKMRKGVSVDTLTRLESTAREARQIREFFGAGRFDLLEGLDATRVNFLARNLGAYRFIHLAAHGVVDAEIPQLSAIILGAFGRNGAVDDQQLWAADLLAQTLDADVVVLSACDTALGPIVAGEGPQGLRYATLARGARSVVASLWPVPDVIGADLMTELYRAMMERGSTVDEALGFATREMLKRSPSLDPALWAPFTVHVAGRN